MEEKATLKKGIDSKEIRNIVIIGIITFFITFLICPFSPYYRYVYSYDEVCYKILVKGLFEGKIPYRDLFDHKGPLTYVIFAVGYLLAGKHDLGMWIVSALLDSIGFIFAYKLSSLRLKKDAALLSTIIMICLISVHIEDYNINIFVTGSKPDNFVFVFLMISAYLLIKDACFVKKDHVVSLKNMFFIGLLCGGVFLIKLNVCLLYFAFIGCYFLWLIIRKRSMDFLKACGVFLGGIIVLMIPFLIFFLATGSLKDFIDIYFIFNSQYATDFTGFFLTEGLITWASRIGFSILLILSAIALVLDLRKKKEKIQTIVIAVLFVITFLVLTASLVYPYFFIVFMVFMIYGTDLVAEKLDSILGKKIDAFKLAVCFMAVTVCFSILSTVFFPLIPRQKTDYETKIEEYSKAHPDANYLFFTSLCFPIYDKYLAEPAIDQFYTPNYMSDEMLISQMNAIKALDVDVIVYHVIIGEENIESESGIVGRLCEIGYTVYQEYVSADEYYTVYMLVKEQA